MRITIELDLDATYHERDNGDLLLEVLTFPGCNQNLLPFLTANEIERAQEALPAWHAWPRCGLLSGCTGQGPGSI